MARFLWRSVHANIVRVQIISILGFVLTGCGHLFPIFAPQPASIPDPSTVQTANTNQVTALKGISNADVVAAGYNTVYKACTDYFDALIRAQNETNFYYDVTVQGDAAAASALDAYATASPAIVTQTVGDAVSRVQHYAEICIYSGISRSAKEAITKAKPVAVGSNVSVLTADDKTDATALI